MQSAASSRRSSASHGRMHSTYTDRSARADHCARKRSRCAAHVAHCLQRVRPRVRADPRAIPDMRSRLALHRLSADALVQRGVLLNAKAALEKLGCSGAELEVIHRPTKSCAVALLPYSNVGVCWQRCCGGASAVVQAKWRANGPLKLGPGLYVSHVDADGVGLYIVNGPPLTRAERPSSAGSAATCRSLHRLGAIAQRSLIDRGCGHIAPTCAASAPAVQCCESPAGVAGRDAAVDVGSLSGFYMAMREKFTTAGAQAPPLPSLLGPTRRAGDAHPRTGFGRSCRYTAWRLSLAAMPRRGRTSEKRCAVDWQRCGTWAQRAQTGSAQRQRGSGSGECVERGPPVSVYSRMCGGCTGTSGWRRACVLQIIGATNPTAAQPGSVRQKILADWQGGLRRIRAVARHGAVYSAAQQYNCIWVAVQRWAWRPSRTRATTACMRAPGRSRACARGWYV